MGQNKSSYAKLAGGRGMISIVNRKCVDCGEQVPDMAEMPFDRAPFVTCISTKNETKCYWIPSKDENVVHRHWAVGVGVGAEGVGAATGISRGTEVKKGYPTIIFMRKDVAKGEYLCVNCFRKRYPSLMGTIRKELLAKALFLSYNKETDVMTIT